MGFHRFEDYETLHLNPLLSYTRGPVIEGEHMYFRRVTKSAGTMSKPHYHANEFMAFMLDGRVHAHEIFGYVISGALEAEVGGVKKRATAGDVIHVPRGTAYAWSVAEGPARYALVRSTPRLEAEIAKNGATDNWRG